ncbi:MAG: NUDIX hydrolase [Luteolibacter sp.]|jgi:ADP-ribose pyrophosphatase
MSKNDQLLYQTPWLSLHRIGHWDYVRRPHAEACVGVLAITDDHEVVLVEQLRIPVGKRVIEIPAGLYGDEPDHAGETPDECAARELFEETGFRASSIKPLIVTPTSAGMTSEWTHLFHATGLNRENQGGGVGGEDIHTHLVPVAKIRSWLDARQADGLGVDFKIHAALWLAGITT